MRSARKKPAGPASAPANTARSSAVKKGWTDERRARHAAAIRGWRPWDRSTGPRTKAGKKRCSRNACKPDKHLEPGRILDKALQANGRYLVDLQRYISLKKASPKNRLLKKMAVRLLRQGLTARLLLIRAVRAAQAPPDTPF